MAMFFDWLVFRDTATLLRLRLAIKELARRFAAQSGDPGFLNMVNRAFSAEAATVAKRQAARQAQ